MIVDLTLKYPYIKTHQNAINIIFFFFKFSKINCSSVKRKKSLLNYFIKTKMMMKDAAN